MAWLDNLTLEEIEALKEIHQDKERAADFELRDIFACFGMLGHFFLNPDEDQMDKAAEYWSKGAYAIADAMLEQRNK